MIDHDRLMALEIPDATQTYTKRDTMLYALGLGIGSDPMDPEQLKFVYEKDLVAMPTMALVLATSANWIADTDSGIDYTKVLDGERSLDLHGPMPVEGELRGRTRVTDIIDKGKDKGALVTSERTLETLDGKVIASIRQTAFCRADGGFGGPKRDQPKPHPIPGREPDHAFEQASLPQQALIYRLSGDYNPLHADPESAKRSGFERPILHGLSTFGVAAHALVKTVCGYDPAALTSISGRFTAPVYPGETLRTEIWEERDAVAFRTEVPARGVTAINFGWATLR